MKDVFKDNNTLKTDDKVLARHEAGHVVAKALLPGFYDFTSISIESKGETPGSTRVKKNTSIFEADKELMRNEMIALAAGHCAEVVTFGHSEFPFEKTSDFHKMAQTAEIYIKRFGCPKDTDALFYDGGKEPFSFLSGIKRAFSRKKGSLSDEEKKRDLTPKEIDRGWNMIVSACRRAYDLIDEHRDTLDAVTQALLEKRTLSGKDALLIVERAEVGEFSALPQYDDTLPEPSQE